MSIAVEFERFILTATIKRSGIVIQNRIDGKAFSLGGDF
jgi:hypothetical protein